MIAVIAEKPSVGQDIARIIGATEKRTGYMQGNGYMVTWASGHLVQLALPEAYGHKRGEGELPLIPDPFLYVKRTRKDGGRHVIDGAATRQLTVIRSVLDQCDSIIAATDAGREGEYIFRLIYNHLQCTLPWKRLWISSMTDEAIAEGLHNLKEGCGYDGLYLAADCRAKADWLVGMNASEALARASGVADSSLGRVQTPTLAMICSRYLENRGFLPSDYWQLHLTLDRGGVLRQFRYAEHIKRQEDADALNERFRACPPARIVKVERKVTHEPPPLLFDLTALQKECNVRYGMSADRTLAVAQSLYEKKLISYPRTGSRYIPSDMARYIPSLLRMILRMEAFAHFADKFDPLRPSNRSVDSEKVTDHHALVITGDYPRKLESAEERVYHLIAGRMLEAFGPRCERDTMLVEAECGGLSFRFRSAEVLSAGWRGVNNHPEERGEGDDEIHAGNVDFVEGETLPVAGHSVGRHKTRPKPLYTEATLLAAMEMPCQRGQSERSSAMPSAAGIAGTELAGGFGIGTPATRAAIIETLLRREYIERTGKSLVPTKKGLYVYHAVKDMRIADVALTGSWEESLAAIERGGMMVDTFMQAIAVFTGQITKEVLSVPALQLPSDAMKCPKCREGNVLIRHRLAKCDNEACGFVLFRKFLNKELTDEQMRGLVKSRKTKLIQGFEGKAGKTFDARLKLDRHFNVSFDFPENKPKPKPKAKSKPKAKPKPFKSGSGGKPNQ